MVKFKAIYKESLEDNGTPIGEFDKRDTAVNALVDYAHRHVSYCLDSREDRLQALQLRNFCMCGCGPSELLIEEIN